MNSLNIAYFFDFCNVKIDLGESYQSKEDKKEVIICLKPDFRFTPRCSHCNKKVYNVHSNSTKKVMDLSMTENKVILHLNNFGSPAFYKNQVKKHVTTAKSTSAIEL